MLFRSDGTLFVAEAGAGKVGATDQSGGCAPTPEGTQCAGNTGSVTAIPHPATATPADAVRVVTSLISFTAIPQELRKKWLEVCVGPATRQVHE